MDLKAKGENHSRRKFLLDVVDIGGVFGEERVIRFEDWSAKYYPGKDNRNASGETAARSWQRLKRRARHYGYAELYTEMVPRYGINAGHGGPEDESAIKVRAGTMRRANDELDAMVVATEVRQASKMTTAKPHLDKVAAGLHREIRCSVCGCEEWLACYDEGKRGTTFHAQRLAEAIMTVCPGCEVQSDTPGFCGGCGLYWSGE